MPYTERLKALRLPSLYYRRRRGDMIAVYQLMHQGMDLNAEDFFTLAADTTTRGHPWKLRKPHATARVRRNSFAIRVVNDWNNLPLDVVEATTVSQFKARLDSHWSEIMYSLPEQD